MGGQNPFMGIAYVVVGGVCVLLGALFTVAHLIRPRLVAFGRPSTITEYVSSNLSTRKLGDHTYLTWNGEQEGSAAVATGRDNNRFGAHAT